MGLVPVPNVVLRFLPLWFAWLLVVVLGRLVCRVAQRIPPVVHLVRRLRAGDGSTPRTPDHRRRPPPG